MEARLRSRRPRRHHEIQAPGSRGARRIKDLPEPPSNRGARHRVSNPPRDREPQARRTELVGESMHGEQTAPVSRALPVNPFKLRRVGQPCTLAPRQRSDSQPAAPATPSRGDDPSPTDRIHALAKAVRFGSLTTIRLVRTLHATPLHDHSEHSRQATRVYPNPAQPSSTRRHRNDPTRPCAKEQ